MNVDFSIALETHARKFDFSECLLESEVTGIYHTRLPLKTKVHQLRGNIDYAVMLLASESLENRNIALLIIDRVLSLQVLDPYDPYYGIWSWYLEEPVSEMSPPDMNWADFIGGELLMLLTTFEEQLTEDLLERCKNALTATAFCIFRRNVRPDYTNICIAGAAVTLLVGKLLQIPLLYEYGKRRLILFQKHVKEVGINEFNSHSYCFVVIDECERILQLNDEDDIIETVEFIREFFWEHMLIHYHPSTGNLCLPHSRAYSYDNKYRERFSAEFRQTYRGGLQHLSCPDRLARRLYTLPSSEYHKNICYITRKRQRDAVYGTLYMNSKLAVGSASRGCFWTQFHSAGAYWKNASFRVRLYKDGFDFSSGGIRTIQKGATAVSIFFLWSDLGDLHLFFDAPREQRYFCDNLILRYELEAPDALAIQLNEDTFELHSGRYKVVVHTQSGSFYGAPVFWSCKSATGNAYVEAVISSSCELDVSGANGVNPLLLGGVFEVLPKKIKASSGKLRVLREENCDIAIWNDMSVEHEHTDIKFREI